jgi:AcrR family transcriptional regulator
MAIEKETEERIFKAAQTIFEKRGFDGARMQEIADEAEINKSMLHYYYRSKDKLFQEVFKAGVKQVFPQVLIILNADISLKEKVNQIVDFYHNMFRDNPHLPTFVTYEMNQHPERFQEFIRQMNVEIPAKFLEQVQDEVAAGNLIQIKPHQFLMNIVSLCMMPMLARQMVQTLFSLNDEEYFEFLEERRQFISTIIFNGVKPS